MPASAWGAAWGAPRIFGASSMSLSNGAPPVERLASGAAALTSGADVVVVVVVVVVVAGAGAATSFGAGVAGAVGAGFVKLWRIALMRSVLFTGFDASDDFFFTG